jgi:hypothetical protein
MNIDTYLSSLKKIWDFMNISGTNGSRKNTGQN